MSLYNILSSLRFKHKAKQESCLSGTHRNIITSLHPAVDYQSLQCSLFVHDCTYVGTVINQSINQNLFSEQ